MEHWTDRIVGDRMAVDEAFVDRVADSQFSRQQWGLVMTAVRFDIESPADEEEARLVSDTSDLPSIISELDSIEAQMAGPGAPGGRGDGGGSGVVDGIKRALGMGSEEDDEDTDEERLAAAEELTQAYADELQTHLEESGKWDAVRAAAAEADQ
ncbi:DUF5799 family protein [Halorientalis halophila]|uniref:DUF5799 family protein n=1 Tax=Halorientalis halophila TaxID=3108499 RepID=UPI003008BFE8